MNYILILIKGPQVLIYVPRPNAHPTHYQKGFECVYVDSLIFIFSLIT